MYRNDKKYLFLGLSLLMVNGCGESSNNGSIHRSSSANQASVGELSTLLSSHPELSRANLKVIKDAANGGSGLGKEAVVINTTHSISHSNRIHQATRGMAEDGLSNPAMLPDGHNNREAIDAKIAKQAQDLIDKVLADFDFAAQFDSEVKMKGISLNLAKQRIERMKALAASGIFGGKGEGLSDKFSGGGMKELPTCEEFVNNPFIKFARDQVELVMSQNKESIKKSLSGCAKISGGDFLQCVQDFNLMIATINEQATCDVMSGEELESKFKKALGEDYDRLGSSFTKCLTQQFAECGFTSQNFDSSTDGYSGPHVGGRDFKPRADKDMSEKQ